jgi:uncharacterized protein YydD (DUF2326 family)
MAEAPYDTVLQNFRLADGGPPGRRLALKDGRIAAILPADAPSPQAGQRLDLGGDLLQKDYQERAHALARAVSLVDHAIGALYDDREGNFIIRPTKNGPVVSVNIGGGGGQGGIDSMKIFCFDMMLYEVVSERIGGPRFLVHASHLFDGVDPRQTRSALLYGRDVARRVGGRYLVTMNSDILESLDDAEEIRAAVIHPRLTDTEDGGLFGFRFDL